MKKNRTKGYAILGILFALVSLIVFVVPTAKTAAFWIAYAFTAAAFAAQIGIWKAALGKEDELKSKFLGFPILHIGIVYAALQLITLAVFMFAPTLPAWSAIVISASIAGISAVCMISADVGRREIGQVEAKARKRVFQIRELQADVEQLAGNEADAEIKAALTQLAEKLRFSDPMSHEQLTGLEAQITEKVSALKTADNKGEILAEIHSLLDERNRKTRILK